MRLGKGKLGFDTKDVCIWYEIFSMPVERLHCAKTYAQIMASNNSTILFASLRPSLVHEATVVRIAALRALRYLINTEDDLAVAEAAGIPLLIVRSLDLVLNNSGERMQAVRFAQKILSIPSGAEHFPTNLTRALVSIGFDGLVEDKLHRSSLSVLCQLGMSITFIKEIKLHSSTKSPLCGCYF